MFDRPRTIIEARGRGREEILEKEEKLFRYVSRSKRNKLIIRTFKRCDICRRVSLSRYGLAAAYWLSC